MRPGNIEDLVDDQYQSSWPANNQPTIDTDGLETAETESSASKTEVPAFTEQEQDGFQAAAETRDSEKAGLVLPATTGAPPQQVMSQPLRPLVFDPERRELTEVDADAALRKKKPNLIILTAQPKTTDSSPTDSESQLQNKFVVEDILALPELSPSIETPQLQAASQPEDGPAAEAEPAPVSMQRTSEAEIQIQSLEPLMDAIDDVAESNNTADFKQPIDVPEQPLVELSSYSADEPQIGTASERTMSAAELFSGEAPVAVESVELEATASSRIANAPATPLSARTSACPTCKADCVCPLVDDNAFVPNPLGLEMSREFVPEQLVPKWPNPPALPESEMDGNSWLDAELPLPRAVEVPANEIPSVESFGSESDFNVQPSSFEQAVQELVPTQSMELDIQASPIGQVLAMETVPEYASSESMDIELSESEILEIEALANSHLDDAAGAPSVFEIEASNMPAPNWKSHLQGSVDLLQRQIELASTVDEKAGLEIDLRLLKILQRRAEGLDDEKLSPQLSQYWEYQTRALSSMLDPTGGNEANDVTRHRRALNTLDDLRNAVFQLEAMANLRLARAALCTEVAGYGQITPVRRAEFKSGDKVLVYCEVENFTAVERVSEGNATFHTRLRGSVVIYDELGNAVQQSEFPPVEDVANNRRRDFYMYMPVSIGNLKPGSYKMHLLVEDIDGNKTASLNEPLLISVR